MPANEFPLPVAGLLVAGAAGPALQHFGRGQRTTIPAKLRLRGDVTVERDVVTIGDLIAGAPSDVTGIAAFRAPFSGGENRHHPDEPPVPRCRPISSAFRNSRDFRGAAGFSVTRAARIIDADEIAEALADAVAGYIAIQAEALDIRFEGNPPAAAGVSSADDRRRRGFGSCVSDPASDAGRGSGPCQRRQKTQNESRVMVSARVVETVENRGPDPRSVAPR